jgi:hypothetical protein
MTNMIFFYENQFDSLEGIQDGYQDPLVWCIMAVVVESHPSFESWQNGE